MTDLCPVCNTELKKEPIHRFEHDVADHSCYRCGDFALTLEAIAYIPNVLLRDKDADLKLSHALRTMQRINEKVELTENQINVILTRKTDSVGRNSVAYSAECLLVSIRRNTAIAYYALQMRLTRCGLHLTRFLRSSA